jgi:hypothetical protein
MVSEMSCMFPSPTDRPYIENSQGRSSVAELGGRENCGQRSAGVGTNEPDTKPIRVHQRFSSID